MTPEQIEQAARELCRVRGIDPDEQGYYPHPYIPGANEATRAWQCYVPEIERFAQVGTAIAAALQHQEKPTRRKKGLDSAVG